MKTPTIDPEFKALIPPLAPDEYAQLEANIRAEGCRVPLVVWQEVPESAWCKDCEKDQPCSLGDGNIECDVCQYGVGPWPESILVDGHNRYEICTRHGIEYETVEMVFESRDAAMLWMEENQLGRRNLSDDQRSVFVLSIQERRSRAAVMAGTAKAREAKEFPVSVNASETGGKGRPKDSLSDNVTDKRSPTPKTDTRKEVAKEYKLPERKLRTVAEVKKAAPEMIAKVRAGETTLLQAKREIKEAKREERREENRAKVAAVATPEAIIETGAKFATIMIDPPWDWGDEGDQDQLGRARPDYATMSKEQLLALPLPDLSDVDCHLYLWITNRSLPKGFDLIERWGFRYITMITWAKPHFGMGNYFRGQTEQVLFAVKGSQPLKRKDVGTLFQAPRGPNGHSSKPPEFYQLVESCSPGPYLEMFSRSEREGWKTWGENA